MSVGRYNFAGIVELLTIAMCLPGLLHGHIALVTVPGYLARVQPKVCRE